MNALLWSVKEINVERERERGREQHNCIPHMVCAHAWTNSRSINIPKIASSGIWEQNIIILSKFQQQQFFFIQTVVR